MPGHRIEVPFKIPIAKRISSVKICRKCRIFLFEYVMILSPNLLREMKRRGRSIVPVKLECPNGCHLKWPKDFLGKFVADRTELSGPFAIRDWGK